jgi:hypothetical protein
MILEGLVTTLNKDGTVNIAPMGPLVDEQMDQFVLRPYATSQTYRNLKRLGQGVLHVTDDVEMMARAAIDRLEPAPRLVKARQVRGAVIAAACRWYEFRVTSLDDTAARTTIACTVVDRGRLRDFFGFNRAKHAVIEAAVLASRCELLPAQQIREDFQRLQVVVDKTAGPQERRAFQLLDEYVSGVLQGQTGPGRG